MIIVYRNFFLLLILTLVFGCSTKQELVVNYSNSEIVYSGRIDSSEVKGAELYWSGSSIKFNFEGESISALLEDEGGDNYYNVIIDDERPFILRPDSIKSYYQLASKLPKGKHTVEIFKRTEWDRGKTSFYGLKIEGNNAKLLPKPQPYKRKMEFYGNSITAGYAIEDFSGKDSPDSTYTNNYLTYAAITARHFKTDYHCICKSGIGITVSWFPLIMPEMYDRLNPSDPNSKWDFSLYSPDIVVINLFQNDSWIVNMPYSEEFKFRFSTKPDDTYFINAYQEFVADIRTHYPKANIICSLGSMDAAKEGSKWVDYVKTAVANLNDEAIYTHIMPYIKASGHPSIQDQEDMANSLIGFIEENIDW